MRNPDRIPVILAALERRWSKQPDLRLGQLMMVLVRRNLPDLASEEEGHKLFNVEDSQLLQWLGPEGDEEERHAEDNREHRSRHWFDDPH